MTSAEWLKAWKGAVDLDSIEALTEGAALPNGAIRNGAVSILHAAARGDLVHVDDLRDAYDRREAVRLTAPEYFDEHGNETSLERLCRMEPAWSAQRIRVADEALRSCVDALDRLMGDSDLIEEDDSPEFLAMRQALWAIGVRK